MGRGKGKISNDLVAASCAAVLAVYAAGYSRTREAARRFETHARQRRPAVPTTPMITATATPVKPAAASPRPAIIEALAPQSAPAHEITAATASVPKSAPKPSSPPAVRKVAPKAAVPSAAVAADSSPSGLPQIMSVPLPADDAVAKPMAIRRDPAFAPGTKWRDGTYTGLGDSPHGGIEARVVIKDGRIVEAGIAACGTRYPCDVIEPLLHQPVVRQSPDVDYMSHATESSDAYYEALVAALTEALEQPAGDATVSK